MAKKLTMTTLDELLAALRDRYAKAGRTEKVRIINEFTEVSGYHRKHALRLVRPSSRPGRLAPRPGRRIYDEAVREALIVLWEASDRLCSKRLVVLLPVLIAAMEKHGHLSLDATVRAKLSKMSAASIDRCLSDQRDRVASIRMV